MASLAGRLGARLSRNVRWWRRQRRATGGTLVGLAVFAALGERR